MPGVLHSNSHCDLSREVGKMAFLMNPDLMTLNDDVTADLEDIDDRLVESSFQLLLSGNVGDFADSDSDLPDNEFRVDLIKYLDSQDLDVGLKLHRIKCEVGCNSCTESPHKYDKYRVSEQQDPFMGMAEDSGRPCTILGQMMSPLDYDSEHEDHKPEIKDTKIFSAWNTPKKEEPDFMLSKSSVAWCGVYDDDDSSQEVAFPDTPSPSTQSDTVAGDDSDVDIETITDTPRSISSCGYTTHESSPAMSPSSSPSPLQRLKNGSLYTILSKSVSNTGRISAHSSASLTECEVSSSSSLAEHLLANRSNVLGQKRKISKERKCPPRTQSSYQHVLCTSNSVNFHDYAMSPAAYAMSPSSTDTGRPTVLSKHIYKRKQFSMDASEKEKQHHHNQLERNRRQKLADLFVDLREEVPRIASQAKASKVLILNEATLFIRDLQRRERQQQDEISKELRRKEVLRKQLKNLEAQISSSSVQ